MGKMEFVPLSRFNNIEFVDAGGFSKIYKATWIDGPITHWSDQEKCYERKRDCKVVLKKLNNSKNITSKELNEVRLLYSILI